MFVGKQELIHAPGRTLWPLTHCFGSPGCRLVAVAARTWIGDFVFVGHGGSDEIESVRAHERAGDGDFDFGHSWRSGLRNFHELLPAALEPGTGDLFRSARDSECRYCARLAP